MFSQRNLFRINYLYTFIIYFKEQYIVVFEALLEAFTLPNTAIDTDRFLTCLEEHQHRQVPQNQSNLKIEFQVSYIFSPQ